MGPDWPNGRLCGHPGTLIFLRKVAMLTHLFLNRLLWAVAGLLALAAAVTGVWRPEIYEWVVARELIPGAYSQDLLSAAAGLALLYLSYAARPHRTKYQIVAVGLLGYLFYAYGIYVIERTYNGLYLLYMAVFALSFWAMVTAGATMDRGNPSVSLSRALRITSASGAMLQPLIFYPLWIGMLLPLMRSGEQIDSLYSIFILDLCFIMPGFLILSFLTFRNHRTGLLLLPALYVLGFTLIFSLAVGELVKPLFRAAPSLAALLPALGLSGLFLVLGVLHLARLRPSGPPLEGPTVPQPVDPQRASAQSPPAAGQTTQSRPPQ
ncbi:putative membrane protein [Arthrobacter sp. B1I2]|nr:putative membrane protein [Arthrobacter sp. B1I2]